jgi:hypothetical protein
LLQPASITSVAVRVSDAAKLVISRYQITVAVRKQSLLSKFLSLPRVCHIVGEMKTRGRNCPALLLISLLAGVGMAAAPKQNRVDPAEFVI